MNIVSPYWSAILYRHIDLPYRPPYRAATLPRIIAITSWVTFVIHPLQQKCFSSNETNIHQFFLFRIHRNLMAIEWVKTHVAIHFSGKQLLLILVTIVFEFRNKIGVVARIYYHLLLEKIPNFTTIQVRLDQDLMITVGIESQVQNSFELEAIASFPRTSNMFYVQRFGDLLTVTNGVVNAMCNSKWNQRTGVSFTTLH